MPKDSSSFSIRERPGLLMLRLPTLARAPGPMGETTAFLRAMPGVRHVTSHVRSGRIQVRFHVNLICPSVILNELAARGVLIGVKALPRRRPVASAPAFGLRLVPAYVVAEAYEGQSPLARVLDSLSRFMRMLR